MSGENLGFQMFLPLLGQSLVAVPMGYLRQKVDDLWKAQDAANLIWEAEGEDDDKQGQTRKSPQLAQADAEVKKRELEVWRAIKASCEFQEGTPRWLRHLTWAWLASELYEFPAEITQAESEQLACGRVRWRVTCRVWECEEHQFESTSEVAAPDGEAASMGPFLASCALAFVNAMAQATGYEDLKLDL
jgi:hypothetical protein